VVEGMTVERGWIKEVKTNRGVITPQIVVNTAGIFADIVADMAKDRDFTLHTVKENMIVFKPSAPLTRQCEKYPQSRSALSVVPMDGGKVAFASRSDGTPKREDYSTNDVELESLFNASKTFIEDIKKEDVYSFSSCVFGRTYEDKLLIRRGVGTKNVIEVADVKDYALTACQAIAVDVAELAIGMLDGSKENFDFDPIRRSPVKLADLSPEQVDETIRADSDYGKIVCRCAQISKGEILDVIKADDIHTVDGVKRRLGVGNGECKGTRCSIKIAEILAEYYDVPLENIKSTGGGTILYGDTKGLKK
jgi:glycerol-3-phosphate dehydrogenase